MKKHLRPPPAFQEYAADILTNIKFRLLSLPERGLWQTMRLECWINKSIPASPASLAMLLNLPVEDVEKSLTPAVLRMFDVSKDQLSCKELEEYRENLEAVKNAQSNGGRKGGLTTQQKRQTTAVSVKSITTGNLEGDTQADVQPSSKLLSVNEVKTGEASKVFIKRATSQHDDWLSEYDAGKPAGPLDYKRQSRGY